MTTALTAPTKVIYPFSDGKRMAENTKQFRWIMLIVIGLQAALRELADVFIAADLLWYPLEGEPGINTAPDVMVAFGRPRGDRLCYKQ